jgi:transcriptional regulator
MYIPEHFEESRPEVLHAFIRQHPLATIFVSDRSGLAADHIPLTLRVGEWSPGLLLGHVARANPLWRKAENGIDCLVVFHGPGRYISPNWYASKAEDGKVVPTWNYEVVHVRGKMRSVDDPVWLRAFLAELTSEHEHSQPHPWQLGDAPDDYISRSLQAIVGIQIEILHMLGKAKLSQNQSVANQRSVVQSLEAQGDAASQTMAEAIRARGRPGL